MIGLPERMYKGIKEGLKPKNIKEKIKGMARMDQVYWSKVGIGVIVGIIFGWTGFEAWPAGITMLLIYLGISLTWFLSLRNSETGIKVRQYFMSAMFQYFLTTVAMWTLIFNILYVPASPPWPV